MRVKSYWIGVYGQVRALQKRFMRDGMSLFFYLFVPTNIPLGVWCDFLITKPLAFDVAII